jgi:hypothetical protein
MASDSKGRELTVIERAAQQWRPWLWYVGCAAIYLGAMGLFLLVMWLGDFIYRTAQ